MKAPDAGPGVPQAVSGPIGPDREQIATFLDVVFGYCDGWIPLRGLGEQGHEASPKPRAKWTRANADAVDEALIFARQVALDGAAFYVVPGTVANRGEAKTEHVRQMQTILVDLDNGDISAKRDHLIRHLGQSTLVVESGGLTPEGHDKLHLWWRLSEAVEDTDVGRVCRLRADIAAKVGGDPHFASAHQPIRVAGSIYQKNGVRKLTRIREHSAVEVELAEFAERVAEMPPMGDEVPTDADRGKPMRGRVSDLFTRRIREGGVDDTTRFEALSRVIGYWIRRAREGHVTEPQAWDEIAAYNDARIDPPWPEERLRTETERLRKRDQGRHGAGDGHLEESGEPVTFTEDDLAHQFARRHGETWRYVALWGRWLSWNGKVWLRDQSLRTYDLARLVCREAAARAPADRLRSKLSTAATVSAVERLARSDRRHAGAPEIWDSDPWLLNTSGGIIDLRSGETGPHDPLGFMTKITSAAPEGDCPAWHQFLDTVTAGDRELQAYLQRMAGYCLTGVTSEHALFFLYGTGANGKSVFAGTLGAVLGDYASVAPMDMFMASHGDRHPTDMAGLRGARMVTSIETEQGSRWAESKLKALTGGDRITARFMRQDFFEFTPQFKLLVVGNHKPAIRNVDEAMRRRLHMIPFTVTIPPHKRDKQLPQRLLDERDGILAWAVQGCLRWQQAGLKPPASVVAATEEYFEAEDATGRWLGERCNNVPGAIASTSILYADWKIWAEANGEAAGSVKRFSEALISRGIARHNTRTGKGFGGLALRDDRDRTTGDQ